MDFNDINTLDDARAFLSERSEMSRETVHMLGLMLGFDEIDAMVKELGVELSGEPGL